MNIRKEFIIDDVTDKMKHDAQLVLTGISIKLNDPVGLCRVLDALDLNISYKKVL